METKTNRELLTSINEGLSSEDQITETDLSRYLSDDPNKKREPRNQAVRDRMNEVMGENSPVYPIRKSLESARKKILKLEQENTDLRNDKTFAYSRLAPRYVAMWITFLLVFLSAIYAPPLLDLMVMRRSAGIITSIEEYAARAAEAEARAELLGELAERMTWDYNEILKKLDELEGE